MNVALVLPSLTLCLEKWPYRRWTLLWFALQADRVYMEFNICVNGHVCVNLNKCDVDQWRISSSTSSITWKSFTIGREKTSSIRINKIRFFKLLHFFKDRKPWHEECFVSVGCLEECCCAACDAEVWASCLRQPPLSGGQQLIGIRHPLARPSSTKQPNINTSTKAADIFHCCRNFFKIKKWIIYFKLCNLAVVGKSIMQIDNRWIDAHRITIWI